MNGLLLPSRHSLKNLLRDRAGAAAVTIAISLTAITGLAGLGTEAANWYLTERSMQGAADAAAHTAATALMNGASAGAAKTEACSVAIGFGFTCSTADNVHIPPSSGSHTGDSSAVEVTLSTQPNLMLSGLFISTAPTLSSRSVALKPTQTYPPCVMSLDTASETSMSTSGSPALALNGCSLYVNSKGAGALNMGGGTITASAAYVAGTVSGSGLTANPTKTGVDPHPDPYASVSAPSYTGCNQNNYKVTGNKTSTISASSGVAYVFCNGLQVQGGSTLNLCPGTYVIDQGTLDIQGGGVLNAPPSSGCTSSGGVTIYLTNHTTGGDPATVSFGANSTVNITAPNSGSLSGMALFQDRKTCGSSCTSTLGGGSTQNITGAMYFPNNPVSYSGGASTGGAVCTQLIAYKVTMSGNSNFNSTCSSAGTKAINVTGSQLVE